MARSGSTSEQTVLMRKVKHESKHGVFVWEKYLQDSDDAACDASASIASLVRVGMIGFAEVVFGGVENHRTADDAARAEQCDDVVGVWGRHDAVLVGDDIAQVTDVTNGILTSSMLQFVGIVMAAGAPVATIKVYSDEIATCGWTTKYLQTSAG